MPGPKYGSNLKLGPGLRRGDASIRRLVIPAKAGIQVRRQLDLSRLIMAASIIRSS